MAIQRLDFPTLSKGVGNMQAQELLAALPVAVYVTDPEGLIMAYNDAAVKLWGTVPLLGKARWCGSVRLFYLDGSPMQLDECPMARALRDGEEVFGAEATVERPDGTTVPFLAYPVVMHDATGAITGAVNTLVEITEQKQTQEARSKLAAIVDSSSDAIVGKDLNGIIRSWNNGAERIFGYSADEVIGKSVTILIPEDRLSEEDTILQRIRRGEIVDHFETIRKTRDGRLLPISLTISPIKADNGRIIGASKIARDISPQKEAEQQIKLLMREISHRVKNQFAVIISMTREARRTARNSDELGRQIEERIMALARSHDLLVDGDWKGATVFELLVAHLKMFGSEETISLSGPIVTLLPTAVQYLGMAFHELATNSIKYGALSAPHGQVAVEWSIAHDRFVLMWREKVAHAISKPERRGFGTVVLERVAPAAIGGCAKISYEADGVVWEVRAPREQVEAAS